MTPKLLFVGFAVSLGAVGCGKTSETGTPPLGDDESVVNDGGTDAGAPIDQASLARDTPSAAALTPAVASNNAFALSLYGQVAPTANGGNLMTSPLSASLALTMTYAGAQGQTATEMASALQLQADGGASIFDGENALSQALNGRAAAALAADQLNQQEYPGSAAPSPSDYQLQVVNSVWGEKTYPWATPFLDVLAQSYGTGVYLEDFVGDPTGATQTINQWVSSETADKINNLLPTSAITSQTRIVLVNAVHLKLPWAIPFDPSRTVSGSFTRGDGSAVTASFMNEGLETGYVETAEAQVVSLPLTDNQLSVVLALPKNGLASLVSSLTPATWAAMNPPGSSYTDVILSLPKFSFTSPSFSLSTALQALGMKTAFDPTQANFKGLCAAPPDGMNIYIADVLQKAMIAVAETGVEAAAATAVIGAGSAAPSNPVTLTFNQPFLMAIVDQSGAIVFLGQIDDPTNAGSP